MAASPSGKRVPLFAVRVCLLVLLMSSALLATGCADLSSDDRNVFYKGWADPKIPLDHPITGE